MLRVYKYPVELEDNFDLDLPDGAQPLTVQVQHGSVYLWALVDPNAPVQPRHFRMAGTGHPINVDPQRLTYVGTVQGYGGALVFHLFEVFTGVLPV